jgi:hypothetical protein
MQQVPALGGETFAPQLGEAGGAPHIGRHAPIRFQQLGGREHLAQDGARAHELHALLVLALRFAQQVHALEDALPDSLLAIALRHGRVLVVLVHQGDVIEDILLLGHHAAQAVVHDHRDLVAVSRVVAQAVGDHGEQHV